VQVVAHAALLRAAARQPRAHARRAALAGAQDAP
jgi:hypothetical protein